MCSVHSGVGARPTVTTFFITKDVVSLTSDVRGRWPAGRQAVRRCSFTTSAVRRSETWSALVFLSAWPCRLLGTRHVRSLTAITSLQRTTCATPRGALPLGTTGSQQGSHRAGTIWAQLTSLLPPGLSSRPRQATRLEWVSKRGGMAEWSMAVVLKTTGGGEGLESRGISNPSGAPS